MTVNELFNHFTNYFDKVVYYDKSRNVQDSICFKEDGEILGERCYDFLSNYGEREVGEWEYSYTGNYIDIELK